MTSPVSAVRAEGLWRRFGRHEALRGLDFTVPEGAVYALIGANGAGKTTALKVLVNLLEPTQGAASVLGLEVFCPDPHADRLRLGEPGAAGAVARR